MPFAACIPTDIINYYTCNSDFITNKMNELTVLSFFVLFFYTVVLFTSLLFSWFYWVSTCNMNITFRNQTHIMKTSHWREREKNECAKSSRSQYAICTSAKYDWFDDCMLFFSTFFHCFIRFFPLFFRFFIELQSSQCMNENDSNIYSLFGWNCIQSSQRNCSLIHCVYIVMRTHTCA